MGVFGFSLMWVGKPAPPSPTAPLSRIAFTKPARSENTGGFTSGETVCLPSGSISTALQVLPLADRATVPLAPPVPSAVHAFQVCPQSSE